MAWVGLLVKIIVQIVQTYLGARKLFPCANVCRTTEADYCQIPLTQYTDCDKNNKVNVAHSSSVIMVLELIIWRLTGEKITIDSVCDFECGYAVCDRLR